MSGVVEEDNDGINITNLFELDSTRIEASDNINNTSTGSPEVVIPKNSLHSTSTLVSSIPGPPSPPPNIRTVYERIQIQIAAGITLNFGLCPRP